MSQEIKEIGPIAGRTLKIASSDHLVLTLNNAFGNGSGNVGRDQWVVKAGIQVIEAWYSVEDNIPDLMSFGNITVRPDADHADTVAISWKGVGRTAAIRPRLHVMYLD